MKELQVTMKCKLPEGMSAAERQVFKGNLIVTWRALVEDTLHEELKIPLTETHKFIGDYSVTETEE